MNIDCKWQVIQEGAFVSTHYRPAIRMIPRVSPARFKNQLKQRFKDWAHVSPIIHQFQDFIIDLIINSPISGLHH